MQNYYHKHQEESSTIHDYLLETGLCTQDTISLVVKMCGDSIDTYNGILYALTGYRSLDQLNDIE